MAMRERSRFKEDKDVLIKQTKDQIEIEKKNLQEVLSEIRLAKKEKSEIVNFLDDACQKKNDELMQAIKKCEDTKEDFSAQASEYNRKLSELNKDRGDFEKYKISETERIKSIAQNTVSLNQTAKEHRTRNDKELESLKVLQTEYEDKNKIADANQIKLSDLIEEANGRLAQIRADEEDLQRRQAVFNKEKSDFEAVKFNFENNKFIHEEKIQENIELEKRILKEQEKVDKDKAEIKAIAEQIKTDTANNILLSKKNAIELQRMKDFDKDLKNREAKVGDRENIMNAKLGGVK